MSKWVVNGLTKKYDDVVALNNVSFDIEVNKIYGLIGNNGAGKTTLMKTIAHQLVPTSGDITFDDASIFQNDKYMQEICLAREIVPVKTMHNYKLKYLFKIFSLSYPNWDQELCEKLLKVFPLNMKKKYAELSKGMQTMIGIIVGLSSRAPLTMFDEPYVGLDPEKREAFYEILLHDFEKHPRTIIISTHLISEIENLFDHVLILNEGELIINEEKESIQKRTRLLEGRTEDLEEILNNKNVVHRHSIGKLGAFTVMDTLSQDEVNRLEEKNIAISSLGLQKLFVNISKGDYSDFK